MQILRSGTATAANDVSRIRDVPSVDALTDVPFVDASIDAANPRTQTRALPTGTLSAGFVSIFVVTSCAVFVLAASQLNPLTLLLSPVALAVVLLYSYTKRFTRWSHLVLGFALGIAPAPAWTAVRGLLDPRILPLTAAVTLR